MLIFSIISSFIIPIFLVLFVHRAQFIPCVFVYFIDYIYIIVLLLFISIFIFIDICYICTKTGCIYLYLINAPLSIVIIYESFLQMLPVVYLIVLHHLLNSLSLQPDMANAFLHSRNSSH